MAQPFSEFAGDKRLLWIAKEWQSYSEQLAEWAMERLVNRRDVWSQYTLRGGEISVVMLPVKERRAAGTDMVTLHKLQRHFAGRSPAHLIGLHSISDVQTARWFAIDVDLHDETVANADEVAEANLEACLAWAERIREMGMDPLLFDSNGVGGYHLWVLLDDDYPLADVYDLANEIRSNYSEFGLERKPEIFPPKRAVEKDDLPYGLRLPGRHHTRPHYSRVRNFDPLGETQWLEGGEAIEAMLATRPAPLPDFDRSEKTEILPARKKPAKPRKPRVCVDLDGVLARYDGWRGLDHIGEPLPGALKFAKQLSKHADIVIFTSRCSHDSGGDPDMIDITPGQMRIRVIDWLEKHKFPFADVYIGQGKPRAVAFIDDRAVKCSPQRDPEAFEDALESAIGLIRRPRSNDPVELL